MLVSVLDSKHTILNITAKTLTTPTSTRVGVVCTHTYKLKIAACFYESIAYVEFLILWWILKGFYRKIDFSFLRVCVVEFEES